MTIARQHESPPLAGPDPADVAALTELLDLFDGFSSNEQRARYLLTCNGMRDRGAAAANLISTEDAILAELRAQPLCVIAARLDVVEGGTAMTAGSPAARAAQAHGQTVAGAGQGGEGTSASAAGVGGHAPWCADHQDDPDELNPDAGWCEGERRTVGGVVTYLSEALDGSPVIVFLDPVAEINLDTARRLRARLEDLDRQATPADEATPQGGMDEFAEEPA